MIDFLLASHPVQVELCNGCAGFVGANRRWEPGEFDQHLQWLDAFYSLWPEFVRRNIRTANSFAGDGTGAAS
jgi:hypothetical protein